MKCKGFWPGPEYKEDLLGEDVFKWKVKDEYLADGKVRGKGKTYKGLAWYTEEQHKNL